MSIPEDASEYLNNKAYRAEWDGEGFPPVGAVVEAFNSVTGRWYPVLMVYSSGRNTAWLELNRDGNIDSSSSSLIQFRPIRSEADKKRDEAITKMVKQIGITPESAAMCYDFCTRVNKK
ncbi:hypothetical protein MKU79_000381 [Enterobacter hormaechei]|nr:hypothetical protein [Enterobacter hormaechei]